MLYGKFKVSHYDNKGGCIVSIQERFILNHEKMERVNIYTLKEFDNKGGYITYQEMEPIKIF